MCIRDRTITAPYWDAFLSNAIRLYENKNPDQHILYDYTYNSLLEYRTSYRTDKFFDQLNLDILAGTIGDIIVTGFDNREGNYDPYPYFHSDLFIDLTDLIQNDPSYEVLDKAVFDYLPIAVSYTHLDVYKRQSSFCTISLPLPAPSNTLPHSCVCKAAP